MAESEVNSDYSQDFATEASLRINDIEERINTLKEKVNLISRNFIDLREEIEERVDKIEKKDFDTKKELESLKKNLNNLMQESGKWVRRDEIVLIERMLKDFQPLEFVRKQDLEEFKEKSEKNKNPKKLKE